MCFGKEPELRYERSPPHPKKEFGMSHQDRTSDIVINHRTIKQVVDWLIKPAVLAGVRARSDAKWKPRMLTVAALLWAASRRDNLGDRFLRFWLPFQGADPKIS